MRRSLLSLHELEKLAYLPVLQPRPTSEGLEILLLHGPAASLAVVGQLRLTMRAWNLAATGSMASEKTSVHDPYLSCLTSYNIRTLWSLYSHRLVS